MLLKEMSNAAKSPYVGSGFFCWFSPCLKAVSDQCWPVAFLLLHCWMFFREMRWGWAPPQQTEQVLLSCPQLRWVSLGGADGSHLISWSCRDLMQSSLEVKKVWKSMSDVRRRFLRWVIPVPSFSPKSLVSVRSCCMVARSEPLEAIRPFHDICWKCATR